MVPDISSLPPQVLTHLFQFLSASNRLSASLVCKKWLHALNYYQLLCDIQIKFSEESDEAIKLFSRMTRRFECFIFKGVAINDSFFEFLKKYSRQFVTLSFIFCEVGNAKSDPKFQDQILHCDNLKSLEVEYSDIRIVSLFASLPNVTTLKLCSSSYLSDYLLSQLDPSLNKLEVLSLGGSVVIFEEEVAKSIYTNGETIKTNPSRQFLSFEGIKMLIEKNISTLKFIDLKDLTISDKYLLKISEIKGLKLRGALLSMFWPSSFFKAFIENQLSLTSLDLSYSIDDTNEKVRVACKCLPNLQKLSILSCSGIGNSIIEIFQLQHLEYLSLSCSGNLSEHSYREAVSKLKTFKLKHLDLAFSKISDESLFELLKSNQNIRFLDLSHTSISNKTLNMICKNLKFLDCLKLPGCRNISDSGLTGEFEDYSDSLTPTPLSNLKYLTELDLSYNSLITNKGCIEAIRFPNLKRLHLKKCDGLVFDNDFEIQLKKQNPSLLFILNK